MFRSVGRPYLNTRVTLMSRRLVGPGMVEKAIETPLAEIEPLLAALGAGALAAADTEELPRFMEQRRLSILLDEILVLARPCSRQHREFLLYWTHALELFNLKAILRGRIAGEPAAAIRGELLDMGPFAALPLEALLRADSAAEVLRLLEATPFAELATQARRVLEQGRDLFFLDTSFDRRFYSGLAKRAAVLETIDPAAFRRLMAAIIDGTNLVWLLRYRFVYGLPPAETYYLLIPAGYDLVARHLKRLTAAAGVAEAVAALPRPLGRRFQGALAIDEVARRADASVRAVAREVLRRSPSSFIRAFAYVLLRAGDLMVLRGVVKAKQLGLPDELARAALTGRRPAEAASA
ncbi:MAG: V-type ATPase subunit [Burkholderiales bacterium]|nr:V-type ATPase subunit [Burkholderiales bacterium]